mmetsp:Transcript_29101/g.47766  ORF Transcript_29101/g.47766 Transcript_29101/m.47766 type:complete len:90 (-) Transcript_29101:78-347(-)
MRSANVGISPVLHAILTSEKELLADLGDDDRKWKNSGFIMNVFGRPEEAFSYPWWNDHGANANLSRERMMVLGEKLWEESTKLMEINGY